MNKQNQLLQLFILYNALDLEKQIASLVSSDSAALTSAYAINITWIMKMQQLCPSLQSDVNTGSVHWVLNKYEMHALIKQNKPIPGAFSYMLACLGVCLNLALSCRCSCTLIVLHLSYWEGVYSFCVISSKCCHHLSLFTQLSDPVTFTDKTWAGKQ